MQHAQLSGGVTGGAEGGSDQVDLEDNIVLLYHLFIINQISFLLMVILSLRKERN